MKTKLPEVKWRKATATEVAMAFGVPVQVAQRALDSTTPTPAVTGNHVHVCPQSPSPSAGTSADEAAGSGERKPL